jgi:hypothetical protein
LQQVLLRAILKQVSEGVDTKEAWNQSVIRSKENLKRGILKDGDGSEKEA